MKVGEPKMIKTIAVCDYCGAESRFYIPVDISLFDSVEVNMHIDLCEKCAKCAIEQALGLLEGRAPQEVFELASLWTTHRRSANND